MYFDRRLWQLTRGMRGRVVGTIAIGVLAALVGLSRFALMGLLIAQVFKGAPLSALAVPAAAVAFAVILRGAMEHWRTMSANRTSARVQEALRGKLYDKIAELGPAWFAEERTGGHVQSVVDGVEQLQIFFGRYVPQMSVAALTPILIFGFIAWLDLPVATVMLCFALFGLIAPWSFSGLDREASRNRQAAFRAFSAEFLDAIQGLATLKAFGQSRAYGRQLAQKARALSNTTMWLLTTGLMTRGVIDVAIALGAAAALGLGAYRVSEGVMSIQALLIVLMAGTEIFRPLRDFRAVIHDGMVGQAAGIAINALLDTKPALHPVATVHPARIESRSPSRTCASPTRADGTRRSMACPFPSPQASASASWARAARANRPSRASCCGFMTRKAARFASAASISSRSIRTRRARSSPSCSRTPICSTARSRKICGSAGKTRPSRSSRTRRARPTRTTSSWRCRRATPP